VLQDWRFLAKSEKRKALFYSVSSVAAR